MSILIKSVIELARIGVLLGIVGGTANRIFVNWLHVQKSDFKIVLLNVGVLILFTIWYRIWGQYTGWYPSSRNNRN